jgi:hypothetical protein
MRCLEHLDYIALTCPTFGWGHKPPCNEPTTIALASLAVSTAAAGAGIAIQYDQQSKAAKQAELNADAQAQAIGQEQKRQALEQGENRRRAAVEQRRFRAAQFSALASTGALTGTGTALDIEADTWAQQQRQMADQQYLADVGQRGLAAQRQTVRQQGYGEASAIRGQMAGTALAGLASTVGTGYQMWTTRPQTIQTA